MKILKALICVLISTALLLTFAFASENVANKNKDMSKQDEMKQFKGDPLKTLNDIKAKINEKYSSGEISKEKMQRVNEKIDTMIERVKEFNKLTLAQKRETLIKEFSERVSEKIKEGKITKEESQQIITDYKAKVNNWDGTGFPPLAHKWHGKHVHGFAGKAPGK